MLDEGRGRVWIGGLVLVHNGLYRPYRAEGRFVEDQGFREALHPWLSCGRSVGALVSGADQDEHGKLSRLLDSSIGIQRKSGGIAPCGSIKRT